VLRTVGDARKAITAGLIQTDSDGPFASEQPLARIYRREVGGWLKLLRERSAGEGKRAFSVSIPEQYGATRSELLHRARDPSPNRVGSLSTYLGGNGAPTSGVATAGACGCWRARHAVLAECR